MLFRSLEVFKQKAQKIKSGSCVARSCKIALLKAVVTITFFYLDVLNVPDK